MAESKNEAPLRITNQFHSKGGMAYDLNLRGARLSLLVTEQTVPDACWQVEARGPAQDGVDALVVTANGPTRRDALAAAGRAWHVAAAAQPRADVFDWTDVAAVLDSVRAL